MHCGQVARALTLDLAMRPMRGTYSLQGSIARTDTIDMSFDFDLDSQSSPDLPGRHRWELVDALIYDCKPGHRCQPLAKRGHLATANQLKILSREVVPTLL